MVEIIFMCCALHSIGIMSSVIAHWAMDLMKLSNDYKAQKLK